MNHICPFLIALDPGRVLSSKLIERKVSPEKRLQGTKAYEIRLSEETVTRQITFSAPNPFSFKFLSTQTSCRLGPASGLGFAGS